MRGMRYFFDGGYAEYVLVPLEIIFPFKSQLSWETLGAIPEMFQTVSGSPNQALKIQAGEILLLRGGTFLYWHVSLSARQGKRATRCFHYKKS
ncbi:MAG: NADPH2:quinone reductase [Psychromonas sp.]|jgi:NADPH2:quinone reductase